MSKRLQQISEPESAATEIAALRDQIAAANHRYYILDDPQLSDDSYDRLMRRLVRRDPRPDLRYASAGKKPAPR